MHPRLQQPRLVLELKARAKEARAGLPPGVHRPMLVLGLQSRANEAWLGLGEGASCSWLVLGLEPRETQAGLGLALQPRVHQSWLCLHHGVNLVPGGSGGQLGDGDSQGGLGYVLQEASLGLGDEDVSLALVDAVAPNGLEPATHARVSDGLVVSRLRAGHVHLVGGNRHPAEQRFLQLHPQDIAVILWGGGQEGPSRPPVLPHRAPHEREAASP